MPPRSAPSHASPSSATPSPQTPIPPVEPPSLELAAAPLLPEVPVLSLTATVVPIDGSLSLAETVVVCPVVPPDVCEPLVWVAEPVLSCVVLAVTVPALPADALSLALPVGTPSVAESPPTHLWSTQASPARQTPSSVQGQPSKPTVHVPVELAEALLLSLFAEELSPQPPRPRTRTNHR